MLEHIDGVPLLRHSTYYQFVLFGRDFLCFFFFLCDFLVLRRVTICRCSGWERLLVEVQVS